MITYQTGGIELVDEIEELWSALNAIHSKCSTHFGDEFPRITYDIRKKSFHEEGKNIFIVIAKDKDKKAGYCVASFTNNSGEIESICVDKNYRGQSIGTALMEKSLDWLSKNNIEKIDICVAVGNEDAYAFYERFGFYPRVTKLTRKK